MVVVSLGTTWATAWNCQRAVGNGHREAREEEGGGRSGRLGLDTDEQPESERHGGRAKEMWWMATPERGLCV